ncbi:hypothetical protein SCG7086_AS_00240 [Chlamydiales bacterium SCGC AG-110-P3]|nr:hypothetical protein SCG7086_AS_00240 [Chlamydiales bacterium SCGC AG-110-P3]
MNSTTFKQPIASFENQNQKQKASLVGGKTDRPVGVSDSRTGERKPLSYIQARCAGIFTANIAVDTQWPKKS